MALVDADMTSEHSNDGSVDDVMFTFGEKMETEGSVKFSPSFYQILCLLISCLMYSMIVIDDADYQGQLDWNIYGSSTFIANSPSTTNIISDWELLKPVNVSRQIKMSDFADETDTQLSDWLSPSLSEVVSFVVMVTMVLMLWQQKELVNALYKELDSMVGDGNVRKSLLQQIQVTLESQQSQFTKTTYKIAAMNKRIDKVASELDDENTDLESMYKYLESWKEKWICQSGKIRQLNPDLLSKLPDHCQPNVDKVIQDQKQIGSYISHAEIQFEKIYRYLKQDNGAVTNIFDDLDYIHDVLSRNRERST